MGNCSRSECGNALCDRYSRNFGFICNECFDELISKKPISFLDFMKSEKRPPNENWFLDMADEEFPHE